MTSPTYRTTSLPPSSITHLIYRPSAVNQDHQATTIMSETSAVGDPIKLPILDISNPDDVATGKAMLDAAARYGFLYVDSQGSDFSAEDVKKAFELVRLTCTIAFPLYWCSVQEGMISSSYSPHSISLD